MCVHVQCCGSGSNIRGFFAHQTGMRDNSGSLPHLKIQFWFVKSKNLKFFHLRNIEKEEQLNFVCKFTTIMTYCNPAYYYMFIPPPPFYVGSELGINDPDPQHCVCNSYIVITEIALACRVPVPESLLRLCGWQVLYLYNEILPHCHLLQLLKRKFVIIERILHGYSCISAPK
jgi:hypothetical protein